MYRKYLNHYGISPEKYVYVENAVRKTALENIYTATYEYCSADSVVVTVDADDELIGRNVLKVFNAAYQQKKAGVVYSNYYEFELERRLKKGITTEHTHSEKKDSSYRTAPRRISHLRSYRT